MLPISGWPIHNNYWLQNCYHKIHFTYLWRYTEMYEAERHRSWSFGKFEHFLLRVSEAQMNTIKSEFVHKAYSPT